MFNLSTQDYNKTKILLIIHLTDCYLTPFDQLIYLCHFILSSNQYSEKSEVMNRVRL